MSGKTPGAEDTKSAPKKAYKVSSKNQRGFRRCGRAFSFDGVTIQADEIKGEELAILRAEPNLVVTEAKA